jgi:NAD(P)-dependent dehydrogenase (short-subunit alcohol dehydrogenase family)
MPLTPESLGTAPGRARLTGRRIVIIGAGSQPSPDPKVTVGNGRAIAILSVREGAAVACVDKDEAAAAETARLCAAEGAEAITIVADVRDADQCERLIHDAHAKLGGLDGLVANVGYGAGGGLADTSPEIWDDVFAVNVRSHFLTVRAAMPLLADGSGIVFIGFAAGIRAGTRLPAYDSSKTALEGLCRHVALEGAPRGIRANHVIPGAVDTPLGRVGDQLVQMRTKIKWPLGRQASAWDIAYATVFMLSGESSYITAQSLVVDGGKTQFG